MDGESLWKAISTRSVDYPSLTEDIEVDVLIIGGGITGVTAAMQLSDFGKKVAIIEAHSIGGVTTSDSTGNLYIAIQPYYYTVVDKFGLEHAAQVAQSRRYAIDYIETQIKQNKIACQFQRRPWYAYTVGKCESLLQKEMETFKKMEVEVQSAPQLPFDLRYKTAMVMPNQARFNPMQYVISLAESVHKKGCDIYENTAAVSINEESNYCTVTTSKGKIVAKKVFLATHTPIGINATQAYTAPYRSYVLSAQLDIATYPEAHLWCLDNPRYSICTHAYKKETPGLFMVAGSHHKTGQGKDMQAHFLEIERYIKDNYPVTKTLYHWSAQHYHSADNLPYIGLAHRDSKRVYMATGYFADGLVYGTLAGVIIADFITKKNSSTYNLFQADRIKPLASINFVMKENLNVLSQYAQDLPIPEKKNFQSIKEGEGQVVEINRKKYAVSRDSKQNLHIVCAVCPHMKCVVNWNNAEQTWDCPCHGSRFTQEGAVIEGPAMSNLPRYDENDLK